ncbi:hypothetical protein IDJ77_21770 [Mucilaginibacter sp. ZT4R22]|uniref:MORN repeat protein n=1 Tax=Mucilaginibacter pankratovii TaxID=2772110 RepID=A0ABR7WXZ8_9SPHI|nr:hypothetical protein [Mucilaginibacter pankratovii]MBD1366457.1 hypothetical protein [Mucilaginibacter pankratovii]
MLKNYLLIIACLFAVAKAKGQQETSKKTNRLTDSVKEVYTVLKSNKYIKQGQYQAIYQGEIPVAVGAFNNDVKTGIWRFFDAAGRLMQTYNYDTHKVSYEAPETAASNLRYFADIDIDSTDVVTKPIKVGGRYYGYLPYLQLFTLPRDITDIDRFRYIATVELLISPLGRLAYYKVNITGADYQRTINMNVHLPNEEDMIFIPAKLNGEPVACRIIIRARITDRGHLDFPWKK